jgi:NADPH:quinone reductase-like Zn-dependent oxidoreductase
MTPTSPLRLALCQARRAGAGIALLAALCVAVVAHPPVTAQQTTGRQFQLVQDGKGYKLEMKTVARPTPGPRQILVRVRAVSLNQRDMSVMRGQYAGTGGGQMVGKVPLSDGAGEVVAVGAGATRFRVGDRVAGIFFATWLEGRRTADGMNSARGGAGMEGMLSEFVAGDENGFVRIPDHLSYEEGATLPCAGVTAYRALFVEGRMKRGDFVLLEGTGGVSTFGLQLAAAAGARPIITSSSDDKIAKVKSMGAFGTVNYRTNPEWQREVRTLTGNAGVDHVLEVGGRDTLPRALEALAYDGHMALIGGLSGFASDIPAGRLLGMGARVTGIYVGSRADFEAMNRFISEHKIRPVIDRVFPFEEAPQAFDFMDNGSYLGKIVIKL